MDTKRKRIIIAVCVVAAVALTVVSALLIHSFMKTSRHNDYYNNALTCYQDGNYDDALDYALKALELDENEDTYLLLADIYIAQGDIDSALTTLYTASYKIGSKAINARLEEVKAMKTSQLKNSDGTMTICGVKIDPEATSLTIDSPDLKNSDLLAVAGMSKLMTLSLTGGSISNIYPLADLTSLTSLDLSRNAVSDISALSKLSSLKNLYLDKNPITDFSAIQSLKSLSVLSIKDIPITEEQLKALSEALPNCKIYQGGNDTAVTDISLGGKTFKSNVTELDLSNTGLSDISPLSKCTNLTRLDLSGNGISDLSALAGMEKLEWLCVMNNAVDDISPLAALSKLTYLDAENNGISSISPIKNLGSLSELWLGGNNIGSGAGGLSSLSSLRRLGLQQTGLTDSSLHSLGSLTGLKELRIDGNAALSQSAIDSLKASLPGCSVTGGGSSGSSSITLGTKNFPAGTTSIEATGCSVGSLSGLESFTGLTSLILNNNPSLSSLSSISSLTNLRTLELSSCGISSIGFVSGLSGLRTLNLTNNSISDLSPLSGCSSLTELKLSYNSVGSLSPLSGCSSLTSLSLDYAGISNISALSGLTRLNYLSLEGNSISDLTPLRSLESLEDLYVGGNGLNEEQLSVLQLALPNCTIHASVDSGF